MSRALAAFALIAAAAPALAAPPDPYDALKAMDGHWIATAAGGHSRRIDNTCAHTVRFFVCEQAVDGQPAALQVFLPREREEEGKLTFKTESLTSAGDPPGPWRELTIAGDTWTYLEPAHGAAPKRRTIVTHSGPDYMRAEIQVETKGEGEDAVWRPVSVETFTRAP